MFSQTLVDGTQQTRKPFTVLASTLLQIGVIGIGVLVPLLYTQRLPNAALKSMLTAPPPPTQVPKSLVRVTPRTNVITRSLPSSLLVAPTVIPKQIAPTSEVPAAPDLSGLDSAANGAGNGLLYGSTGAAPPPPPPIVAAKPKAAAPVRVGGVVAEANVLHRTQPVYPQLARSARVQGTSSSLQSSAKKAGWRGWCSCTVIRCWLTRPVTPSCNGNTARHC